MDVRGCHREGTGLGEWRMMLFMLLSRSKEGLTPILVIHPLNAFLRVGQVQNVHSGSHPVSSGCKRLDGILGLAGRVFQYICPADPQVFLAVQGRPGTLDLMCSSSALPLPLGCSQKCWKWSLPIFGGLKYALFLALLTDC